MNHLSLNGNCGAEGSPAYLTWKMGPGEVPRWRLFGSEAIAKREEDRKESLFSCTRESTANLKDDFT